MVRCTRWFTMHAFTVRAFSSLCLFWLALAQAVYATEQPARAEPLPAAAHSVSAEVIFVSGQVAVERAGETHTPSLGDSIEVGDRIDTGADGYLHLRFGDGGLVSVRPGSQASIDVYGHNPAAPAESRVRISLKKGALRSVTGDVGERAPEQFRVNTPVAAIGIRGTDFVVYADETLSRLAVRAGGVVMAPFGDTCLAAAFTPCTEGAAELFASTASFALLEVRAGDLVALVTTDGPDPDDMIPPHPQESTLFSSLSRDDRGVDTSPTAPRSAAAASSYEDGLERIARFIDSDDLMQLANLISLSGDQVIQPRDRKLVSDPKIVWGRWSELHPDSVRVSTILHGGKEERRRAGQNRLFQLAIVDQQISLPTRGQASFKLNAYEAYVVRGARLEEAGISNAALVMDFDQSRFATRMDLHAESLPGAQPIVGTGVINARGITGYLEHDARSPTSMTGVLSNQAAEAGLLFDYQIEPGVYATGATHWVNDGRPDIR